MRQVSANYIIAQFDRAFVFIEKFGSNYFACGQVVLTSDYAIVQGHFGECVDFSIITSIAIPHREITLIEDRSVHSCSVHEEMEAETKVLMESANAKESSQDG